MYFLPAGGAGVVLEGRPLAAAHTVALATTTRSVTAMRTVALAIVSIITDCVRTVQTPPRLGINACFEHKSLVTSDIHDRPTHEEVDLAHVKRLRRTLRGHWRTLAQAVCLSRRFGDHPRYDHEHKN